MCKQMNMTISPLYTWSFVHWNQAPGEVSKWTLVSCLVTIALDGTNLHVDGEAGTMRPLHQKVSMFQNRINISHYWYENMECLWESMMGSILCLRHCKVVWTCYQIHKIAGCACTRNVGKVFPTSNFKANRYLAIPACIMAHAWRTCPDACRVANPLWQGKRSWHSRRMRNPQFYVSGKRPMQYLVMWDHVMKRLDCIYPHTSNIRHTLVGNKIVNHSYVVGTAPTVSSFLTQYLASMDWAKTAARRDEKHFNFGLWCELY